MIVGVMNAFGQAPTSEIVNGINLSQIVKNDYLLVDRSICDTVYSIKTRHFPSGLTWDGQYLWFVDSLYIYKVSNTGTYIDSINNPAAINPYGGSGGLTFDGMNLWYADEQSAQLFKINPSNGIILQQFNLPSFGQSDPNGWGLAWDGTNIWHSQYNPPRLYKLNSTNGNIIDSMITQKGILGLQWINGNLFGIHHFNNTIREIYKINPLTGAFLDSASWCISLPLGFTWDGSNLWNVSGTNQYGGTEKIYKINSDIIFSIGEYSNGENLMKISPNPFTSKTTITFSKEQKNTTITITDLLGKVIKSIRFTGKQLTIEKAEMTAGIYFVLTTDEHRYINNRKIVIE